MCRDRLPVTEGVVVKDSGEAGGDVGKESFAEGRCRDGIDSK